MNRPNL